MIIIMMALAGFSFNRANACTITISAGAATICSGASVTFTGTIAGATGMTTYQWKKNGVAMSGAGANGSIASPGNGTFTFTASGFSNGDVVTCYITQPSASFSATSTGVTLTVHANPASISGTTTVGTGGSLTLTDVTSGGAWSGSHTSVATIGTSGVVTGVAVGTSTISYTVSGCSASATVTDVTVAGITGTATVCSGKTVTLADATTGGTWSSGNTSVATVGSATGVVTGVAAGTAVISYKVYGAVVKTTVTVNNSPAAITGSSIVGIGGIVTLSDATSGGSWTSSNTSVATVCVSCGGVTGIASGTGTITYTYNVNGCIATTSITVVPVPAITGVTTVCAGAATTLSDAIPGGTWSTGNAFIATVGSAGVVTGVEAGVTSIYYKVYGATVATTVTVSALPSSISGATTIGAGGSVTLSDATSGGAWSSSRTAIAAIGSATGVVTGVSAGTSVITYKAGGCSATVPVTVTSIGAITGATAVCTGATTTLSDAAAGGAWSSHNAAIASVGSATGVVTGIAAGTTIITYTVGASVATAIVAVNASPNAGSISGPASVTIDSAVTLTDGAGGGSWSTANFYVASVTSGGVVTGVSLGTASIVYTVSNGCGSTSAAYVVAVTPASGNCSPIISTVAGCHTSGYSGDGGAATAAKLSSPYGVAVDASGNIYIADNGNNCVRKVATNGLMSTFAGTGTAGYSGDGSAATAAKLSNPYGVACDASGNVFIAEKGNNCIRKVNGSGIISTYAGNGTAGYTGDGGAATAAELNQPCNVATDASGNLYIVDFNNSAIRKVTTSGIITTVAGNGTPGFSGDGGAATAAKLYHPTQVACDGSGNLYIDDENNDRIRKVNTSGIICTFAGNGTDGFAGDGGPATAAELNETWGVCTDGAGNVFIVDQVNERIRRVDINGIITTYCGTGVRGADGDGGAATAAQLYNPYGVCADGSGNIYIADNINQCIRKISVCSMGVSPVTGASNLCSGAAITLADATTGGTWSTSNSAVATVSPTGVVTGVASGTVSITYTKVSASVVTLTVMPSPSVAGTVTNVTCNGYSNGNINLSVTGGSAPTGWLYYTYLWNNGSTASGAWGVSAGTYSVTATDPNGCSSSASFTVAQPASMVGTGTVTNVSVYGGADGTIAYTVTGGTGAYTYEWNNGETTENISSLTEGTYFVTATDINGCTVTDYFGVAQPACTGRHANPQQTSAAQDSITVNGVSAYPNPFTSATQISFTLSSDAHTTVDVYNAVNGQRVARIFEEDAKAGAVCNCTLNAAGLSAGAYIYNIVAGGANYTGKVVLQ